jgi:hypothetical protein
MEFSAQQVAAFGAALNEATLVAVEVSAETRGAAVTFSVLALPADGVPPPSDPRVRIVLQPVGRIAASLLHGSADDPGARVEEFELGRLEAVVASFGQQSVYGWKFLDVPETADEQEENYFPRWGDRLSLDWRSEPGGLAHSLELFQESSAGDDRQLDLRLWFDELRIFDLELREIAFDDFTAAGARWWDALFANDPRTQGHGIVPGS